MPYNFDVVIDRKNTNSLKWNVEKNVLPMWVADMDIQTAPEIIEDLEKRVAHGVFGYSEIPKEWNKAICTWWETRHDYSMKAESLMFCTGVIPAISSIVRKMTTVGENILLLTPAYNNFFNCIRNNGRNILESKLKYDNGTYQIDFEDLENKLKNPQTTMIIFCNPHNPIGKIWDRETLVLIGELCEKHGVLVLSDEIHCDLTDLNCSYIPFASVSPLCEQNSITCIAPTKAFNLAGLQTAAVMVPNTKLRHKVWRGLNTDEVAEPNSFAVVATIAAFTKGGSWLDALRAYITQNKQLVDDFLKRELPEVKLVQSQATYLLWLDCKSVSYYSKPLCDYLTKNAGLMLSSGASYGESGNGFLRMNIACPKEQVMEALKRFKNGVEGFKAWQGTLC